MLQIILLGYAANMEVKDIRLGVCDQDMTVESRRMAESFLQSGSFALSRYYPTLPLPSPASRQGSPPWCSSFRPASDAT